MPATRTRNVTFSSGPNAIERAVQGNDDSDADSMSHSSGGEEENQVIPEGVTVSAPLGDDEQVVKKGHKKTMSTDTTATTNTTNTVDTHLTHSTTKTANTANEKRPEDDAPELSVDELLQYREYRSPFLHMHGSSLRIASPTQNLVLLSSMFSVATCAKRLG